MQCLQTIVLTLTVICKSNLAIAIISVARSTQNNETLESSLCNTRKCIMKCCSNQKLLKFDFSANNMLYVCDYFNESVNFHEFAEGVFKYSVNYNITVKAGIHEASDIFQNYENVLMFGNKNLRLTEDSELEIEKINSYGVWDRIPNDRFCWDYKHGKQLKKIIFVVRNKGESYQPVTIDTARKHVTGILVSCFFLILMLFVHVWLPELRNLHGLIIVMFTTSYLGSLIVLALLYTETHEASVCIVLTCINYYLVLASTCWMNVLSYDIWEISRYVTRLQLPSNLRQKVFLYFLHGWGTPLVLTLFLYVINETNMKHIPWFITPMIPEKSCFLQDGVKFIYLILPIIILLVISSIFCIMTSSKWWKLIRTPGFRGIQNRTFLRLRIRLPIHMKLYVVMCLNCVLEIISSLNPGCFTNFYNDFMGLIIFIIFICRREIMGEFKERLQILRCRSTEESRSSDSGDIELRT